MKTFFLLAALLPFAALLAVSAEEAVVTLTSANYEDFIANNKVALVEFYAPWCGHCKSLAPEYEKAAKKLKGKVPLAKVDATVERDLAEKFEIRGYPTIKFIRNGNAEEYGGGRTEQTIVDWIESNTGPAVVEVTEAEFETLKKEKPVVFSAKVSGKDAAIYTHFEKIADANRDLGKFVVIVDKNNKNEIAVDRKDEGSIKYTGAAEYPALLKFIKEESFPLYGPINGDNFAKYQARTQDLTWVVASASESVTLAPVIREVAAKFRDSNSFVHLDTDQFASHAENSLGVSEFPALVIQKKSGRFVYPEKDMSSVAKLTAFFSDVKEGKVKRSLKSEPIPESQEGKVKVIVGNSFQDIVLQKDKDVFLEVYAPWCGHCKKLESTWNELAEAVSHMPNVIIAKMDGTANESPVDGFDWSGFPSLFFVKAGSTEPLKYNGGRTKEDLLNYVKQHSSVPFVAAKAGSAPSDEL